jgi:predicted nuclease with TOPRIM domain
VTAEVWTIIGAASGALVTLVGALLMLPKIKAEARKTNAEASGFEWHNLYAEIKRLDGELAEVRTELASVKTTAATEKAGLEIENKALKSEVRRLKRRVSALEDVFKIEPPTPAQQAELDKLKDID